jgi:Predicted rRNA methylase
MVDLVVVDVSFISLRLVLPCGRSIPKTSNRKNLFALIKPQYEAGPRKVGKKGVVRNKSIHRETVVDLLQWIQQHPWTVLGVFRSPIQGGEGNVEYFTYLSIEAETVGGYDWKREVNELFQNEAA